MLGVVFVAYLALFSLKSAHPQSGFLVDLAAALFQITVAIAITVSGLKLGSEPKVEAPLYFLVGCAFSFSVASALVFDIAYFGLGFGWQRAGGTLLELGVTVPYLLFFLVAIVVLMLMMGDLNVANPLVAGWAVSMTLFIAAFVLMRGALFHAPLSRQSQILHVLYIFFECGVIGLGLLPVLFANGVRFRLISAGLVAIALSSFLFQIVEIYRVLAAFTTWLDLLGTVGELAVAFGLQLAREEASAFGGPRQTSSPLPLLRQIT